MNFLVRKGTSLRGEINIPGDKSMSHRAIMLASLSEGKCQISGLLEGEDCLATIDVFRKMGVNISSSDPIMWKDIFLSNNENIIDSINEFEKSLSMMKELIINKDEEGLVEFLSKIKALRDNSIEE